MKTLERQLRRFNAECWNDEFFKRNCFIMNNMKKITLCYISKQLDVYCVKIEHLPKEMGSLKTAVGFVQTIENGEQITISGINGIDSNMIKQQYGSGILSFEEDNRLIEFHFDRVQCIDKHSMVFYKIT
jgi:hypothetical protein